MGSAHGDLLVSTAAALEPIFAQVAKADRISNQGAIAIGDDADLVLVDIENYHPIERQDIISKCGWSPFQGWNLTGDPVYTIGNGNIVYEHSIEWPDLSMSSHRAKSTKTAFLVLFAVTFS